MSQQSAQQEAIRLAISRLANLNINSQCQSLGLPQPDSNGFIRFRAFGENMILETRKFELRFAETAAPAKSSDLILLLHYLLCDLPLAGLNELISFRDIPGGLFYWNPFILRTIQPLINKFGNNINLLRQKMDRLDWEQFDAGDFGARILAFGKIYLTLVYRTGDEEFSPTADILFAANMKRVFNAEDVVVLTSRLCSRLLV